MSNNKAAPKPFERDWLKEAYEFIQDPKKKGLKREHLEAVVKQVKAFENSFTILENRMNELYTRECENRKKAGLPPPPVPPSFKPQGLRA